MRIDLNTLMIPVPATMADARYMVNNSIISKTHGLMELQTPLTLLIGTSLVLLFAMEYLEKTLNII